VELGADTLNVTDDVSGTSLVAHEGGEVDGLLSVVLGELSDAYTTIISTVSYWF
jgi:hypothetical protein